jgi:hypothetical protein
MKRRKWRERKKRKSKIREEKNRRLGRQGSEK